MIKKLFKKTEVKKNLLISLIGVGIGQLIHLGTTPIISRLYTPEVFGQLSLFISIFGILTSVSIMKMELAIIVAEYEEVGALNHVLKILGVTVNVITILATLVLYYLDSEYFNIFLFLSLSIFISNRFWTQRSIVNKEKNFKALSLSKVLESFTNGFTSISLAYSSFKDIGLLISKTVSIFIGYLILKKSTAKTYPLEKVKIKNTLTKYKNFPKYSFPDELVSHLNTSTLIFSFTYFFTALEVGLIGLTARVLASPANFISVSFYDVFKQKAVEDFKANGEFLTIFKKFFLILLLLAIAMSLTLGTMGPMLFDFVFGSKWINAGVYAQYLSILYAIKLMTVPLTFSLEIRNLHHVNLIFQSMYLVLGIIIIPTVYFLTKSDIECIKYYSLTLSLLSIIQVFLAYKASKSKLPSYLRKRL